MFFKPQYVFRYTEKYQVCYWKTANENKANSLGRKQDQFLIWFCVLFNNVGVDFLCVFADICFFVHIVRYQMHVCYDIRYIYI